MDDVKFDTTAEELALIGRILDRAERLGLVGIERGRNDRMALMMDLSACHSNGCPMDFGRMLAADDFNFAHDLCGIHRHIDRVTGQLMDSFLPRFARLPAKEGKAA